MESSRFFLARQNAGLKQIEVAKQLGLKSSAVSKWEKGLTIPDGRTLIKLAQIYHVSSDYLLGLEDIVELFDDARIERPEILDIWDRLTPAQQENLLNYARGIDVANELLKNEQANNERPLKKSDIA